MDDHVEPNTVDKQAPLDYGVQIRFIDDLQKTNKIKKLKKNVAKSGSYGVVVRVQGISGQPFVVLNNSDGTASAPGASSRMDYIHEENTSTIPGTQMQRATSSKASEFEVPENPYPDAPSMQPYSLGNFQCISSDEETGSKCKTKVYDSELNVQNDTNFLPYTNTEGLVSWPHRSPVHQEEQLRRFHSHGSLLISDEVEFSREPAPNRQFLPEERPGFRTPSPAAINGARLASNLRGKSQGTQDHELLEKPWSNAMFSSTSMSKPVAKATSVTDILLQSADNAIDTKPLSSVDTLISKFDGKGGPERGRAARRNRISPNDRRRSQSLDSREPRPSSTGLELRKVETNHGSEASVNQKPFRSSDTMDVGQDVRPTRIYEIKPAAIVKQSFSPIQFTSQSSGGDKGPTAFRNKPDKEPVGFLAFNASSLPRKWNQNQMEMEPMVEKNKKAAVFTEQDVELKCTPDLLKDQKACTSASEELTKQLIFSLLKEGSIESNSFLKRKANLVFDKLQGTKGDELSPDLRALRSRNNDLEKKVVELQQNLEEELTNRQHLGIKSENNIELQDLRLQLEENIEERTQLHALYQKNRKELQNNIEDLKRMKMEKDALEAEMKDVQEEMLLLQKELKSLRNYAGDGEDQETLQELARTKEELDMVATAKKTVEDNLRQRERELTALKGVLKEEVTSHDKAMEDLTAQYQKDMEHLRKNIDEISQNQQNVESERQKVNSVVRNLQQQLQESTEESAHWKEMFQKNREELRSSKQELLQMKMEKEEYDEELRDLRDRYFALQVEVDHVKQTSADVAGMETLKKKLEKAKKEKQEMTAAIEHQETLMKRKEKELFSEKEALIEKAANHAQTLEELKQRHQKEVEMLRKNCNLMAEEKLNLESEKGATEQAKKASDSTLKQLRQDNEDLKKKVSQLDFQLGECRDVIEEFQGSESRLKDKITRLEMERKQMEQSLGEAIDQEQEIAVAKRVLENRLEETQRNVTRVTEDLQELNERFQDEMRQKEQLKKAKNELEEQKRFLDKTVEKLQKEVQVISEQSGSSVVMLQSQLEEHRDKSRRELLEQQRQVKEKALELEKANLTIKRLQDEISRLKQELQQSNAEKENVLLDKDVLGQRVLHLEQEIDTKRRTQDDKSRLAKVLEDKVKRLELELDEEKSSVDLSAERINRSREQIEQLRSELMQERAARQNLECDKISLERQNKDLKSRLANSEGSLKPNVNLSQLESRIRELEDQLQSEERERSILQASNRKLERKIKELTIQLDDERQHVSDEKDQLTLRVKALKRQVDEAEEEIERLEAARKKSLRELEEVHEANEQLQNRIKSLEKDIWRKNARSNVDLRDDDLSSEDEFESTFNPSSVTSLITESNLQASSC